MTEELIMQDMTLDDLEGVTSSPGIEIEQFEGKMIPVEKVTVMVTMSKYGVDGKTVEAGKELFMPVMKIETAPVTKNINSEGEEYEIRASELFSLKVKDKTYAELVKDLGKSDSDFEADKEKALTIAKNMIKEKKIGWSTHEKGALFKFLKKMKVAHPKDLIGRNVLIITRAGGGDSVFLGYVKE